MNEKSLTVTFERDNDNALWGRIENKEFTPYVVGKSLDEVEKELRASIADFKMHEGANSAYWSAIDADTVKFEFQADLTFIQDLFKTLNISAVADMAELNQSLLRQYVSGAKKPSEKTKKEIERTLHNIGSQLMSVQLA